MFFDSVVLVRFGCKLCGCNYYESASVRSRSTTVQQRFDVERQSNRSWVVVVSTALVDYVRSVVSWEIIKLLSLIACVVISASWQTTGFRELSKTHFVVWLLMYTDRFWLLVASSVQYVTVSVQCSTVMMIIRHKPMLGRSLFLLRNRFLALVMPNFNRSG